MVALSKKKRKKKQKNNAENVNFGYIYILFTGAFLIAKRVQKDLFVDFDRSVCMLVICYSC